MRAKNWLAGLCAAVLMVGGAACAAPEPVLPGEGSTTASTDGHVAATESVATDPPETTPSTGKTTQSTTTAGDSASSSPQTAVTVHDMVDVSGRLHGLRPVASFQESFAKGYDTFALQLIQQTQEARKNGFVSPASVYLALGMVTNGAAGETARQLFEGLGVADIGTLNQGCRDLQSRLTEKHFKLANGIWILEGEAEDVLPAFLASNREYFGARVEVAPFDSTLTEKINRWVSDNTAGRIPDLMKEPPEKDSFLMLINALLFEGAWAEPFTGKTVEGTFHGAEKDVALPLMNRLIVGGNYYEDASVQATRLKFDGTDTSMLFALPKQEGAKALYDWIQSLTAEKLRAIVSSETTTPKLSLTVPKCKLSYDRGLEEALQAMGIRDAFTGQADFSKMARSGGFIGGVTHRTELEIDEKGVLAAAATGVTMARSYQRPPEGEPKEMRLDRPFFCAIVDNTTGAVLFGGAVAQPRA